MATRVTQLCFSLCVLLSVSARAGHQNGDARGIANPYGMYGGVNGMNGMYGQNPYMMGGMGMGGMGMGMGMGMGGMGGSQSMYKKNEQASKELAESGQKNREGMQKAGEEAGKSIAESTKQTSQTIADLGKNSDANDLKEGLKQIANLTASFGKFAIDSSTAVESIVNSYKDLATSYAAGLKAQSDALMASIAARQQPAAPNLAALEAQNQSLRNPLGTIQSASSGNMGQVPNLSGGTGSGGGSNSHSGGAADVELAVARRPASSR